MSERGPAQDRAAQAVEVNQAMRVLSHLIAGVGVWGLFGWLADRALGTGFLLPVGILLGAGLAIYMIIARFGSLGDGSTAEATNTQTKTGKVAP